jgi:hypothetical protein
MNRRDFLAAMAGAALATTGVTAGPKIASDALSNTPDIECGNDSYGRQLCTVGISSFEIQKAAQRQYMSQWCWAACISMIFDYYEHPVSQDRIVREAYGGIVNMPGSPQAILRSLNRRWTDDNDEEFRVTADPFTANYLTAIEDLKDDEPQLIGALGHAVVLTAMTYYITPNGPYVVSAIVRDPWPGNASRREMTRAEWYNVQLAARIRLRD